MLNKTQLIWSFKGYKWQVKTEKPVKNDIVYWCEEQFNPGDWLHLGEKEFLFKEHDDAVFFDLTWG